MPIIEGADLTSVSTKREAYPDGEYLVTIIGSELDEKKKNLLIQTRIEEPSDLQGRKFTHWINIVQNDGKPNRIGWTTLKRYLEAVFGVGSPESKQNDSDPLTGHTVHLQLDKSTYKDKDGEEQEKNEVKRIWN